MKQNISYLGLILLILTSGCKKPQRQVWFLNDSGTKIYDAPTFKGTVVYNAEVGSTGLAFYLDSGKQCEKSAKSSDFCRIAVKNTEGWVLEREIGEQAPKILFNKIPVFDYEANMIPAGTKFHVIESSEAIHPYARPGLKAANYFYRGKKYVNWLDIFSSEQSDRSPVAGRYVPAAKDEITGHFQVSNYPDGVPSAVTLQPDGTFNIRLNHCEGMMDYSGPYQLTGSRISLLITSVPDFRPSELIFEIASKDELIIFNDIGCNPGTGDLYKRK